MRLSRLTNPRGPSRRDTTLPVLRSPKEASINVPRCLLQLLERPPLTFVKVTGHRLHRCLRRGIGTIGSGNRKVVSISCTW